MRRVVKSNDLGLLLETRLKEELENRGSLYWRLHTIRSWKGVTNPCDFIVLDKYFTALIECKATADTKFSCSTFRQLNHFEKSSKFSHIGLYGVLVYFASDNPVYVYASDSKVIENRNSRRPIRADVPESYDFIDKDLRNLIDSIVASAECCSLDMFGYCPNSDYL